MAFDPTVRLGDVIIGLGILGGAFSTITKIGRIEQKVDTMYEWFKHSVLRK